MVSEDGQVRSHPYAGTSPKWNEAFAENASFGSAPTWPVHKVKRDVEVVFHRTAEVMVTELLNMAAEAREEETTWPSTAAFWQSLPAYTGDDPEKIEAVDPSVLEAELKKLRQTYCYLRPLKGQDFKHPMIVQNPASDGNKGCHVGFIDVSRKKFSSKPYSTRVKYLGATDAARMWTVAQRLAEKDGATFDDWREVQDVLDRLSP
jgi:hypothetical protein